MAARHVVFLGVTAGTACSLLYAGYDTRFQTGDGGLVPLVTEDGGPILSIAVTSTDLFYAVGGTIKRKSLDGGDPVPWWSSGDGGSVTQIVTDGTDHLAWFAASQRIWVSSTAAPADAATTFITVQLAASSTYLAWIRPNFNPGVQAMPWTGTSPTAFALPDGSTPGAIALDDQGVDIFADGRGLGRYGLNGGVKCPPIGGSPPYVVGLAAPPSGSPVYEITATSLANKLPGPLEVDPALTACSLQTTPLVSNQEVYLVTTDDAAAYWIDNASLVTARFGDDAATTLTPPSMSIDHNTMAVGNGYVYVVSGPYIYAISKPDGG